MAFLMFSIWLDVRIDKGSSSQIELLFPSLLIDLWLG
jgi:hypothetical protein